MYMQWILWHLQLFLNQYLLNLKKPKLAYIIKLKGVIVHMLNVLAMAICVM